MFELPRTLRSRLTGYFLLVFAVLQLVMWTAVNLVVSAHLRERFDADLLQHARALAQAVSDENAPAPGRPLRERVLAAGGTLWCEGCFFDVHTAEGVEVAQSANLSGLALPDPEPGAPQPGVPHWQAVSGPIADALCGQNCRLRVASLSVVEGPSRYVIRTGAGLTPLERTVGAVRSWLVICTLVSLVTAGVASWIVVARALAPLEKIAARARDLSADRLDERLPEPTEGDEVADMIAAINQMLTRFEGQFKNQQRFISSVSHELRTPLAVLMLEIQVQRRKGVVDPELRAFFDSAEEEVARLLRMVEGFLILTRARLHRRLETVADVSVEDVVVRAVQDAGAAARAHGVRIVPHLLDESDTAGPTVSGDGELLINAVRNLLSNAIRYSPAGGTVDVEVRAAGGRVRISVRDQGPGVAPEHQAHIFDMFYQVASRSGGGTAGVGLAIVKTVVDLHRGAITMRNLEGGGCEFTIELPMLGHTPAGAHPVAAT